MSSYQAWLDGGGYEIKKRQPDQEKFQKYQEPLNNLLMSAKTIGGQELQSYVGRGVYQWAEKMGLIGLELQMGKVEIGSAAVKFPVQNINKT